MVRAQGGVFLSWVLLAACGPSPDPWESEGAGAVGTGQGAVRVQSSRAESLGWLQRRLWGLARLARGLRSMDAVQAGVPDRAPLESDVTRQGLLPHNLERGPEPGTASRRHRLGSQQGLLNTDTSVQASVPTPSVQS